MAKGLNLKQIKCPICGKNVWFALFAGHLAVHGAKRK